MSRTIMACQSKDVIPTFYGTIQLTTQPTPLLKLIVDNPS
jgi:hypothetical protein